MIFYKRSGTSSSQQALQDAQDYLEADYRPLGFSDIESWLWFIKRIRLQFDY